METIVCLTDAPAIAKAVDHILKNTRYRALAWPASQLSDAVRERICAAKPRIILLELTRANDNAHLFFFLRADARTRNIPVILIIPGSKIQYQASVLEADGYLPRMFTPRQLHDVLLAHLPRLAFAAA